MKLSFKELTQYAVQIHAQTKAGRPYLGTSRFLPPVADLIDPFCGPLQRKLSEHVQIFLF